MAYDFSTRLDRLGTRMKQINNNTLSYQRTGETPITITNFTPQKVDINELALFGITLIIDKMQDIVFDLADLAGLTPPEPQNNDRIVWEGRTYEVYSMGDQLFRFTTSTRLRIRIHTKQVI